MSLEVKDLAGFSKPVGKLIDAVRDGIGVLYEPVRIRRRAEAEGRATIIRAKTAEQVRDLRTRAAGRALILEERRQANIESVAVRAAEHLPEQVSSEPVDPDWVIRFFGECQDVSNKELQDVWARILAGEVSQPGSFCRRTLSIVRDLSTDVARAFSAVCAHSIWIRRSATPLIASVPATGHFSNGIYFGQLKELEAIGLISFESAGTFTLTLPDVKGEDGLAFSFLGKEWIWQFLRPIQGGLELRIGCALFTQSGSELCSIVEPEFPSVPDDEVHRQLCNTMRAPGRLAQPLPTAWNEFRK